MVTALIRIETRTETPTTRHIFRTTKKVDRRPAAFTAMQVTIAGVDCHFLCGWWMLTAHLIHGWQHMTTCPETVWSLAAQRTAPPVLQNLHEHSNKGTRPAAPSVLPTANGALVRCIWSVAWDMPRTQDNASNRTCDLLSCFVFCWVLALLLCYFSLWPYHWLISSELESPYFRTFCKASVSDPSCTLSTF